MLKLLSLRRSASAAFLILLLTLSTAEAATLRVVTFNVWFLNPLGYDLAEKIPERLKLLPGRVAATGADVIALQEVWGSSERKSLIRDFKTLGYTYAAYKRNSIPLGNGLLLISKFPLDPQVKRLAFADSTCGEEIAVSKGGIKTRVQLPQLGWVDLYNAHLGAVRFDSEKRQYDPDHAHSRAKQANELYRWVLKTRQEPIMLMAVDLNAHYEQRDFHAKNAAGKYLKDGVGLGKMAHEYALFAHPQYGLSLMDTFRTMNPGMPLNEQYTFDTTRNSYAAAGSFKDIPSELIDYIFISRNPQIRPIASERVFLDRLGAGMPDFLSDHYGVLTTFETE